MANGIISALLAKAAFVVSNQRDLQTVLKTLKVSKVSIRLSSDAMRHMLEDGTTRIDTRVVKPIRIVADIICPDLSSVEELNQVLTNRKELYQITTRGLIIPNMMLGSDSLKQTGEMISATPVRLSFDQVLIEGREPIVFSNDANASAIDRGIAVLTDAKEGVSDFYSRTSKAITGFIS